MKKAWRLHTSYGTTYIVLFLENGRYLEYYKESDKVRGFKFSEWLEGVPQGICTRLNEDLKSKGEYTKYIEGINTTPTIRFCEL